MITLKSLVRFLAAQSIGCFGTLVAFGLLLGLAWLVPLSGYILYKEITLLLVAGMAIVLGGFISGSIAARRKQETGLILGTLFGLASFSYVLGPRWVLLALVPLAALAGWLGGRLAVRY